MIPSTGCCQFSLAEIQSATGDFSNEHVIGNGGFGKVYKGLIDNGSASVAIKRGLAGQGKGQGQTEFAAEIETLTQFRHRNLVSLIGYCNEEGEMILVYDYMSKGTLAVSRHSRGINYLRYVLELAEVWTIFTRVAPSYTVMSSLLTFF
ncbi:non-specific serine/threonine protein kinase [Salvia divinorum]|uniref:Non-specific serine/threonine protein kinase n=1 Tax=Salvia divinorum TaxID=28513 RepID=A0ABD1GCZ1_SALDI